eukprot:tig00021719_g23161.t1
MRAGKKTSHWMWFIFPQLRSLGTSAKSRHFGIASLDEARAYLAHPLLGPRLREVTALALEAKTASAVLLFGPPDDLKFSACMTLFDLAAAPASGEEPFAAALEKFFKGRRHERTLALLGIAPPPPS